MNRIACTTLLIVLSAAVVQAQPANDQPSGLSQASGLGTEEMLDYLKAFRTASTTIEVETRGETRRMLNAHRIHITANWAKVRGSDGPVLRSATIRPTAGGRLHLGDLEVNSITINSKGEIKIDKTGIDVTIYKITRKANGDLVLDLPWYAFGDKTVKASDIPFDIKKWPPELQELIEALMNPRSNGQTSTRHEARVAWDISGEADPHPLPFGDGNLKVASSVNLKGAAELRPDGSIRTIGDGNTLNLRLQVNRGGSVSTDSGAGGTITGGTTSFSGRYGINIPAAGGDFGLTVDGRLDYSLDGNTITLNVPGGPILTAANGHIDGNGRLSARFGSGGSDVALRDGVYNLRLNGPLGIQGLRTEGFTLDDLQLDGELASSGTLAELSKDRILTRGSWNGRLEVEEAVGLEGRIRGETGEFRARTELERGSKLTVRSDDAEFDARLTGEDRSTTMTGRVEAETDLTLGESEFEGEGVDGYVERARVTGRVSGDLGGPNGETFSGLQGDLGVDVERGGAVTRTSTPSDEPAPVVRDRQHVVKANETVASIAADYNVAPARIRSANGLRAPGHPRYRVDATSLRVRSGPSTDFTQVRTLRQGQVVQVESIQNGWAKLVGGGYSSASYLDPVATAPELRVGQTLTIPGGPTTLPTPGAGTMTTRIDDGTSANVELTDGSLASDGRFRAKGFVSSTLRLRDLDLRGSGTSLQGRLLATARATLPRTAFELGGERPFELAEVKIPVRIDLSEGSRLHSTGPAAMDIVIDRPGSYLEFEVLARYEQGKLVIPELQNVDLLLHSNGAAKFAGDMVDVAGDKSVKYTGRMVFLSNGIDFHGDMAVIVSGGERPALRIRW